MTTPASSASLITNVKIYGHSELTNGQSFKAEGKIGSRTVTINVQAGDNFPVDELEKILGNSFVGKITQVNHKDTIIELQNKSYKDLKISVTASAEDREAFQQLKSDNVSLNRVMRMSSSSKRAFASLREGFKDAVDTVKITVKETLSETPSIRLYDPAQHLEVILNHFADPKNKDLNLVYNPTDSSLSYSKKKPTESQKETTAAYILDTLGKKIEKDKSDYENTNASDKAKRKELAETLKRDNLILLTLTGKKFPYSDVIINNENLNKSISKLLINTIV